MTTISIIIASYNSAKTIGKALASIKAQSFRDLEVIVVDGNSSDSTVQILRERSDIVTKWQSEPDSGVYDAWNKGLKLCEGEWIYFLGSDDYLWQSDSLEQFVKNGLRENKSQCKVLYGQVALLHDDGTFWKIVGEPWEIAEKNFNTHMTVPHQGVFHHRSLFTEIGNFNDKYKIAADYEWLLRARKKTEPKFVPVVVAAYATDGLSSNPKNIFRVLQEWRQARINLNLYHFGTQDAKLWLRAILLFNLYKWFPKKLASKIQNAWRKRQIKTLNCTSDN